MVLGISVGAFSTLSLPERSGAGPIGVADRVLWQSRDRIPPNSLVSFSFVAFLLPSLTPGSGHLHDHGDGLLAAVILAVIFGGPHQDAASVFDLAAIRE
jgi:hypothetical protein